MRAGIPCVLVLLLSVSACRDDDGAGDAATDADAGGDGGAPGMVEAPDPPVAPAPAALPALTPCAPGWTERADPELGVAVCEPWSGDRSTCGTGELRLPGEPACRPAGGGCPLGGYSPDLPAGASTVYVDAAAVAPGDGSMAAPYVTIGDAISSAAPGTVVALAAGTYDESVALPSGVTLFGACAAETRIAPSSGTDPAIVADGVAAVVQNVSIGGSGGGALIGAGHSLTLTGVVVDDTAGYGVLVAGGAATLTDVAVRNVRPRGFLEGRGLDVDAGGEAVATGLTVRNVREIGVRVSDGSTLTLSRAAVREVQTSIGGILGRGVEVIGAGASFEVDGLVVEDVQDSGISAFEAGSSMTLRDVLVRRVARNEKGEFGTGIDAVGGAEMTLSRVLVEDVFEGAVTVDGGSRADIEDVVLRRVESDALPGAALAIQRSALRGARILATNVADVGVLIFGVDATLELADVTIRDVDVAGVSAFGPGINAYGAATLEVERLSIERVRTAGLLVLGASVTTLRDVVIEDVEAGALPVGRCLEVTDRATVVASRVRCRRATDGGVVVSGARTMANLTDLEVRESRPNAIGQLGRGLEAQLGATVAVVRGHFAENHEVGVLASDDGTSLTLEHVAIVDMQSRPGTGELGRALQVQRRAEVVGTRVRVAASREVGVLAVAEGSAIFAELIVEDTQLLPCAMTTCVGAAGGTGVNAQQNGTVALSRFVIRDNPLAGLQIVSGGQVDLRDGEVARNTIGVNIQDPDYDLGRLMTNVSYRDNGIALDTRALPVPDANVE